MSNFELQASPADIAAEATQILVPKGTDNKRSREAFMEATGFEIPEFRGEQLLAYSQGKEFALVRAAVIPSLVAMGNPNPGERIGFVGTDVRAESMAPIRSVRIGDAVCRLSILSSPQDREWVTDRLVGDARQLKTPLSAITAYPRLLGMAAAARDLPVIPMQLPAYIQTPLKGSGEIMPELVGARIAADLMDSGMTARENNKVEVMSVADIYPELIIGVPR